MQIQRRINKAEIYYIRIATAKKNKVLCNFKGRRQFHSSRVPSDIESYLLELYVVTFRIFVFQVATQKFKDQDIYIEL